MDKITLLLITLLIIIGCAFGCAGDDDDDDDDTTEAGFCDGFEGSALDDCRVCYDFGVMWNECNRGSVPPDTKAGECLFWLSENNKHILCYFDHCDFDEQARCERERCFQDCRTGVFD